MCRFWSMLHHFSIRGSEENGHKFAGKRATNGVIMLCAMLCTMLCVAWSCSLGISCDMKYGVMLCDVVTMKVLHAELYVGVKYRSIAHPRAIRLAILPPSERLRLERDGCVVSGQMAKASNK